MRLWIGSSLDSVTVSGCENAPLKAAALKRWMVIDLRWKRKEVSQYLHFLVIDGAQVFSKVYHAVINRVESLKGHGD